jgi:hypothetical protein
MPFLRLYNTLLVTGTTGIRIPIIKRAVVDFAVSADWTPAAGDVTVKTGGGASGNITNLPTAITRGNTAEWEFILTAAELSGKTVTVLVADAATKVIEDQCFIVETYGNASAMYAADLSLANLPANVVQLLGTAWLTPGVAGTPDVNAKQLGAAPVTATTSVTFSAASTVASTTNITAGTITTTTNLTNLPAITANWLTAAGTAADFTTEIQAGLATPTNITAGTITTVTNVTTVNGLAANVITAASIATGAIDADALAADAGTEIASAVWDMDATAHQTGGTFGQAIGDPGADTNTIFKAVVTDAAGATIGVDIVEIEGQTDDIGVAGAGLTNIGTIATVTTLTNLPAITANWLTAAGTAADFTTEIQAGLATPTNITAGVITTVTNLTNAPTNGDLTATMKTSVNTEVLDVLNTDTFAEPGQEAPAATNTLVKKIGYLYKFLRNKKEQTATTLSIYDDAGTTVDQKATVSDDATTYTHGEIGTGP